MKLAFISDIHGNYDALCAVLDDAAAHGADRLFFLGDYIFDMPFSIDVMNKVWEYPDATFIKGNKEGYLDDLSTQNQALWQAEQLGVPYQTYREMPEEMRKWLMRLPKKRMVMLNSGRRVFAIHRFMSLQKNGKCEFNSSSTYFERYAAQPFTHEEYLAGLEKFYAENMADEFDAIGTDIIAYGHDHLQGHAYCNGKLIIDPGSCGLPLDGDNRAAYTLVEETGDGFKVEERRVEYDVQNAIALAKETDVYSAGKIWCDVSFTSLLDGWDHAGMFLRLARDVASVKHRHDKVLRNSTWHEAFSVFNAQHGCEPIIIPQAAPQTTPTP